LSSFWQKFDMGGLKERFFKMADKVTTTIYSNTRGVGRQSKADVLDTLNARGQFLGHIDREQKRWCYDIHISYIVVDENRKVRYRLWLNGDGEPIEGYGMNFERAYSNMLNRLRKHEASELYLSWEMTSKN